MQIDSMEKSFVRHARQKVSRDVVALGLAAMVSRYKNWTQISVATYGLTLEVGCGETDRSLQNLVIAHREIIEQSEAGPFVLTKLNELILSEYVEGTGNNKALEIYNGTGASVDLSPYTIQMSFNGGNSVISIDLQGQLLDGEVHVLVHGSAESELLGLADQVSNASWFNGDDAVYLVRDDVLLDVIRQIGFDPGSAWGSDQTSTANHTLRRKPNVQEGDPNGENAFDPTIEWEGFPVNHWDDLGVHRVADQGETTTDGETTMDSIGDSSESEGDTLGSSEVERISAIQGNGVSSPMIDQEVTVEAIVTAEFQAPHQLSGFFIQEELSDQDDDIRSSEGLFVFHSSTSVAVGDVVRVSGTVVEFQGKTELADITQIDVLESGVSLPEPVEFLLPVVSMEEFEAREGMVVTFSQVLTVTENYNLGRFGSLSLSSGGRLQQPNQVAQPGPDALAQQVLNDLNRIVLDDYSSQQNPDPVIFPFPELSAAHSVRSGYVVEDLQGVLDEAFNAYRIQSTVIPGFHASSNPRSVAPEKPSSGSAALRVASFNVLNYFNGDGVGGGFPTSRGADTSEEFDRQSKKIEAAILAMDADILGLVEVENDGYGTNSAIVELVDRLNGQLCGHSRFDSRSVSVGGDSRRGASQYAFVPAGDGIGGIGTDEIAVGLIYRSDRVRPIGTSAILDGSVDSRFDDAKNRPALAQTFELRSNQERLTVVVNHLKSKGSSCDAIGDPDRGDGQGNCNQTRHLAVLAELDWLASDPTASGDPDFLVLGDLNAYAQEDPIQAFGAGGFVDLAAVFEESSYSYVFFGQSGSLDYALAGASLASQVCATKTWHINADEPRVLDYNTEFKSPGQLESFYASDPFRSSDHDPLIVDLELISGVEISRPWRFPDRDFPTGVSFADGRRKSPFVR